MTDKAKTFFCVLMIFMGLLSILAGCSPSTPSVSKTAEQANFKGGPMPESAQLKLKERLRDGSSKNSAMAPGSNGSASQ